MGALISAPIGMAMTCCGSLIGSCCASLTCRACSCACLVPSRIASFVYISLLTACVFFGLIMRYQGGDVVIGGGYNASEASAMDQMQHWAQKGTGISSSWNSKFWCAPRHPDAWVICCEDVCGGSFAVYRFSFALCLFFAFLMLLTLGTTVFGAKAHRGFWFPKIFLLLGLLLSTLFIDNHAMEGYREAARYLSWCFLVIQIVLLIDFGYTWNEKWLRYDEESDSDTFCGSWKSGIVFSAAALYLGSIGMWVNLYVTFGGEGCPAQQSIISLTLILSLILTVISCTKFAPHGTLLTSAVVTSYATFLCYSALASHPHGACNPFAMDPSNSWSDLTIGLFVAAISVASTASATTSSKSALIGREQGSEMTAKLEDGSAMESGTSSSINGGAVADGNDVGQESWWFYHLMMVACSMYMAMLLTDWSSQPAFNHGVPATMNEAHAYDTSLASFWVKVVAQWICLLLYGWTLLAPYCLRDYRDFGIEFDLD